MIVACLGEVTMGAGWVLDVVDTGSDIREGSGASGEDVLGHLARHVRQPEFTPAVVIGQPFVVETHGAKNGRVEIVDVQGILNGLRTELVGRAVSCPPLTPPPAIQTVNPNGL